MGYFNSLVARGAGRFVQQMKECGLSGAIVPDLPPEEAQEYLAQMELHGLDPIFIFSPNTPNERMRAIAGFAKGFVYCVARKGVTGASTQFSTDLDAYLARCRQATTLPLAVGFGVRDVNDLRHLVGKVDIAVVGSESIRVVETSGVEAIRPFIRGLKSL
jgi:tryptophan synthase alpha chain